MSAPIGPAALDPVGVERRVVAAPGGRSLLVRTAGRPDDPLVLVLHGTPGCADLLPSWVASARSRRLRLAGFSRAGYAGSTRAPGRSVADVAADAAAVADALGAPTMSVWGISGGGPHALACAALLPGRVRAVAVLAGVAPSEGAGPAWTAGMGPDNVEEFAAAAAGEAALRALLVPQAESLSAQTPAGLARELAGLLPPVDAAVLTGPDGTAVARWMVAGLRQDLPDTSGVDGWVDDDLAFVRPWGFDPGEIRCRTLLVQGNHDLMVPPAHAHTLAELVGARAELRELPDQGHLSLVEYLDVVHAWLTDGPRPPA